MFEHHKIFWFFLGTVGLLPGCLIAGHYILSYIPIFTLGDPITVDDDSEVDIDNEQTLEEGEPFSGFYSFLMWNYVDFATGRGLPAILAILSAMVFCVCMWIMVYKA